MRHLIQVEFHYPDFIDSTDLVNNLLDDSEAESIEDVQADSALPPPTLPIPAAPVEPLLPSTAELIQQIKLPFVKSQTAHNVLASLGFQAVSYGNAEGNAHLPFYSCTNTIKRALRSQERYTNKKLKTTPCIMESTNTDKAKPRSHGFLTTNSSLSRKSCGGCICPFG